MVEPELPLTGVTILAWEQAVSLPMATRLLGDLGATVIRLESHIRTKQRPRYLSNDLARNKKSVAIDLRAEEGQELVKALVERIGILCENFTPRVKRQFRLSFEELRQRRDDLVMLSLSGYGQTGKWSERPTFGPGIEAAAGHARSIGFPDGGPTRPGTVVYADNISGFYAAFALVAALNRRRMTGLGQFIDLSMYEANAYHLALSIARSSLTGVGEPQRGNSEEDAAFQDVLLSNEPERWVAVTVHDHAVDALRSLLGISPSGIEEVSAALRKWLRGQRAEEAVDQLQSCGIAASIAATARDLFLDPQLRSREAFSLVEHDEPVNNHSAHPHASAPWIFDERPRPPLREAPAVGQHSREVLTNVLGLSNETLNRLIASGVVGEPSTTSGPVAAHIPEEQARRQMEWRVIAGFDADPEQIIGL